MRMTITFSISVLCAVSVYAAVNVPLTRLNRQGPYLKGSTNADRARAVHMKNRAAGIQTGTVPATNLGYNYITSVGIGNPPTYYNLIVDTGSSNTFCGTGTKYVHTTTSIPTGQNLSIPYGSGKLEGIEYFDQVTLAPNLVITNQSIGDALSYSGFQDADGVIGMGPVGLTNGTLSPDDNATIPTVMNNAASQHLIEHQVLGVFFAPTSSDNDTNGALTYGGDDPSMYIPPLIFSPVTTTSPATKYWGINVTSATYGSKAVIPQSTAGIVDTGSTQVLLADDFFAIYVGAIPGAKLNNSLGLLEIPKSSIPKMQPLTFFISEHSFIMDIAAQLIPASQNEYWGGDASKRYGVLANLGFNSGGGFDFVLGQKFLERYYSVYDAGNNRIGFASTKNTLSTDPDQFN